MESVGINMGTIDQKMNDYVWDNLDELKAIFSEKVYRVLLRFKDQKDREGFSDTLEVILNSDKELFTKIKSESEDIENMSLEEVANAMKITPYDNFIDKKKYIDRAEYWVEEYSEEDEKYALLLNNLAEFYYSIGEYQKAKPLYQKVLKIWEKLLGENHLDTAGIYNNLALLYNSIGKYQKAERLYRKALKIREEALGEKHPNTAESYHSLATLYQSMGKYQKAERLYRKALKIREEALGEKHPNTAESYHSLATLYWNMGEYQKAESFHSKALKIKEEVLGEKHPNTVESYNSLALLYWNMGEYQEAERLYLKVLKIREEVLGEEHLSTGISYNNLALLYTSMEEYQKAEPLYLKDLKISEKILGEEHPDTATSYNNLANLYYHRKKYQKAEHLYQKALKIREKVLGEEHHDIVQSYNNLAELYRSMGKYQKAKPLYLKALKISEKVLGKEHPYTAISYNGLAGLYESIEEYQKVEPLYLKALKIREKVLGEEHFTTITTANNFDNFMEEQNRLFFLNSRYSSLTCKIDNIEIKNFKQYKTPFSMEFSDQINIIVGQNATGKTTLLQAITLGLLKDKFLDARGLDYDKYITKDENESEIIIGHNGKQKVVKLKKDGREIENNYFIPFVLAYGSNFFTKYDLSADKIVDDILNETIHKKTAYSIFEDYVDKFWNPLTILNELDRSDHKKAKRKKCIFFIIINKFLEEYKIIEEKQRYFFQKGDDKTKLYLEDLSEGYRGNVLLITDMLIKILGVGWTPKTIEGIILIDEFDKHLHPKWQSKLVNQLTETFPKIQFIMTTHNPMSILGRDADEITKLVEIDGKIEAVKEIGTKNIDVGMVLLKYFNVDSIVGDSMRKNLNEITKIKLKGRRKLTKEDKERIKEIEQELQYSPATDFIYNRAYYNFLVFLKENKGIDFENYENLNDEKMLVLQEEYKGLF